MLTLARQTVRGRRRMFVSTFIILALAAALVTAAGVLVESGVRGQLAPVRYAGAAIVIAGRQQVPNPAQEGDVVRLPERVRVPVSVAGQISTAPGVRAVIINRAVPVTVAADSPMAPAEISAVLGQGWSSAALWPTGAIEGRPPKADHEVAVSASLAARGEIYLGDSLRITTALGVQSYAVVGLVAPREASSDPNQAAFFTDDTVTRLTLEPNRADALGVLIDDGANPEAVAAEIRSRLDPAFLTLTGPARSGPESLDIIASNELLTEFGGAFGGTALMLAVFVVAATLGMTVLQRGREIALLRAVGATPRQVRRMLVAEAVIIALTAALAGVGPGLALGAGLFGVLRANGIIATSTLLRLGPLPVSAAIAAVLVVASTAAWLAGRRASRLHPTLALSEAAIERRRIGWLRLLTGVVLVTGGLSLSIVASTLEGEQGASAVVGVLLTLIIGVAALGPLLARGAGAISRPLAALRSPASRFLAVMNLRARARRLSSASTPLTLAVAVTVTMVGSLTTEAAAAERQSHRRLIADKILTTPHGLPADLVETVRSIPGVSTAVDVKTTTIGVVRRELLGERIFEMRPAVGLSTSGIDGVLDLDVQAGSMSQLRPGNFAVSTEVARSASVKVGDFLQVWLGDGTPVTLQVQATYARSVGFGDFIVAKETIIQHVTNPVSDEILIGLDASTDQYDVEATLAQLTAQLPNTTVVDRARQHTDVARIAGQETAINYLFVAILAMFVTVAMINSLVMATGERAREFALLRLLGATPRQVRRMIRWETTVLASYGTVLGLTVAAATLVPFSIGIADTPTPSVPPWFLGPVVVGALAAALIATETPTRLALRNDPTEIATRIGSAP